MKADSRKFKGVTQSFLDDNAGTKKFDKKIRKMVSWVCDFRGFLWGFPRVLNSNLRFNLPLAKRLSRKASEVPKAWDIENSKA